MPNPVIWYASSNDSTSTGIKISVIVSILTLSLTYSFSLPFKSLDCAINWIPDIDELLLVQVILIKVEIISKECEHEMPSCVVVIDAV